MARTLALLTNISNAGSLTALANNLPPSLWVTAAKWKTPYAAEWNLDVQHQFKGLRNTVVDLGYVGNKGTHLVGAQDINQVKPGVAAASGLYANPYAGGTECGGEAERGSAVSRLWLYRSDRSPCLIRTTTHCS